MASSIAAGAARVDRSSLDRLNPFRITGTDLPPNLLLAAKLVTLCFLVSDEVPSLPGHFVPYLTFLDDVGSRSEFHRALQLLFVVAAVALFLNLWVRTACLTLGGVLLVGIVSSRVYFANNIEYTASILILAGLYQSGMRRNLVQYQVMLLYFGAALNKLLDAHWRNGEFFQRLGEAGSHSAEYHRLSSVLPGLTFAIIMSWLVIVTEFALVAGFTVRRLIPFAIWVGIGYHTALFVTTGHTFGMFWYATACSYLAFVRWPTRLDVVFDARSAFWRAVHAIGRRVDFENRFTWTPGDATVVTGDGRETRGTLACLFRVLLANPVWYMAFAFAAAVPEPGRRLIGLLVFVILGAYALAFLNAERLRRRPSAFA